MVERGIEIMIGLTQDSVARTLGISVRRAFNRNGEQFNWPIDASPDEIAAQLRAAASYIEQEFCE